MVNKYEKYGRTKHILVDQMFSRLRIKKINVNLGQRIHVHGIPQQLFIIKNRAQVWLPRSSGLWSMQETMLFLQIHH